MPPLRSFDEQYLKADRFIAFTAEPYEYHRDDWPSEVRLVGPGRWEPTAEALAGENVSMTVSTAAQDPAAFAAPANAHIERFLPHGPILERAACVVSHGGQGITVKALPAGSRCASCRSAVTSSTSLDVSSTQAPACGCTTSD